MEFCLRFVSFLIFSYEDSCTKRCCGIPMDSGGIQPVGPDSDLNYGKDRGN